MPHNPPPTMDPQAAARWQQRAPACSPWLHEEVAQRMHARLDWMLQPPRAWCHWQPVRGGLRAHALLRRRYPQVPCQVFEPVAAHARAACRQWGAAACAETFGAPEPASVDMLWANMALHLCPAPQALLAQWQQALAVDGYVMFSCLGPDTLRELRALYARLGWPPPGHRFTDMHDWGDMLVQAGFADPVMDMERITLTFATPQRLLQELRELGRNLHPQRLAAVRPRAWRHALHQALDAQLRTAAGGPLALTFEIVYGHAFKAAPRAPVHAHSAIPLHDMQAMLRRNTGFS